MQRVTHLEKPMLFSGVVVDEAGQNRMHIGAYVPEDTPRAVVASIELCVGFMSSSRLDRVLPPQPHDGWMVRPMNAPSSIAAEGQSIIASVLQEHPGVVSHRHLHEPVSERDLIAYLGRDALYPPKFGGLKPEAEEEHEDTPVAQEVITVDLPPTNPELYKAPALAPHAPELAVASAAIQAA